MKALRRRIRVSRTILAFLVLLVGFAPATLARDPDGADRLFDGFVQDGEVLSGGWLEGRVFFQNYDTGERYGLGGLAAFTVAQDFEFGMALAGMVADPELGGSSSGLSDIALYGKARLMEVPFVFSVGGLMTLPSGNEKKGLGTGEVSLEGFTGFRWYFDSVVLVANAGLRLNQDSDVILTNGGFPVPSSVAGPGGSEGKVSGRLGAGFIFLLTERWDFSAEFAYESARYESLDSDLRLTVGGAYRLGKAIFRGAFTAGLSDGAPDFAFVGAAAFRFGETGKKAPAPTTDGSTGG